MFDWFYPSALHNSGWIFFAVYTVLSYAFLVWAHRFSIRATGMRDATYEEAFSVCLAEFIAWRILAMLHIGFPWLFLAMAAIRVLAFKYCFKAETGKAMLGAFVSTALSVFFTMLYFAGLYMIWMWLFKRPPF